MSKLQITNFKLQTLGSILVPIFLFTAIPQAITDQELVEVTFQIKSPEYNQAVFSDYSLDASYLFQNIYKTEISTRTFDLMSSDPRINYVQRDSKMTAAEISVTQLVTANDPFFTLDATKEDRQWYLPKTQIPDAWEYTKGSTAVTVAIIDTGIHASHIELNDGRVGPGYDVFKKEIIPSGGNSDGTGDTSDVAAGIVWAADNGANIINLSMGGPGFGNDMTLSNAISYAYNKGLLLVSAAGNDTADVGNSLDKNPIYPVCGDNGENMIIGVAATDINDQKAGFSNFGAICLDIAAPGKKIITTTYLPSDPANNLLIYGSGTSLATPIVSGVAALLKAQNPNLSNVEIRNLLLRSVDNIDGVNQTSCLGSSCNGLLGKGRINALNAIKPQPIPNGTLMRDLGTGDIYFLVNGTKRLVIPSVFVERGFDLNVVVSDTKNELANFSLVLALTPPEGTLIKSSNDQQVYIINSEMKRPLTYLVFISRGYKFSDIKVLPTAEVAAFTTGEWYWPPDGTMVLIKDDPTVFVMDQGVRRPSTYFVFTQRNLSFKNVVNVTRDEFGHIPVPRDNYWLAPLDGTLIKSDTDPGIYVIENGTKRLMSFEAFAGRGYLFSSVKTLPQAEVEVVSPGLPILN